MAVWEKLLLRERLEPITIYVNLSYYSVNKMIINLQRKIRIRSYLTLGKIPRNTLFLKLLTRKELSSRKIINIGIKPYTSVIGKVMESQRSGYQKVI